MVATAATRMPIAPIRRSLHARTMTAASLRRILPARVGVVIQKRVTPGFPRDGNASFYLHSGQPEPWRANLVTYLFREQKMAKTKWPKLPRFFVPLFHCANVYLCRSKEEWQQAEKALGVSLADVSTFNGMCRQFVNDETGENLYLVGVFDNNAATLVHECAHATFYCCNDVGVTVDTGSANETYCYLLDRMFTAFLPHIKQD